MEKVNCAHSTSMCTKLFLLKTDIRLKMHVQILCTNIFPNANIHTLMQGYWIKIHMDKHIKSQVKPHQHISKKICNECCLSALWQPSENTGTCPRPKAVYYSRTQGHRQREQSTSPTEYPVTIICLILRVKAAENLPETRKYYQTKIIWSDRSSAHWLEA